jgi:uncharacterized cofD-like protein
MDNHAVVGMGGGSGSEMLAQAMRPHVRENYTAIVGTFDNGGSTGDIRKEYGGWAVGDLRRVCGAMSQLTEDAKQGLEWKFGAGTGESELNVKKHAPGNLILANYIQMFPDDPERVVEAYSNLWRIEGNVFPIMHESRQLHLQTTDGQLIEGEHAIDDAKIPDLGGAELFLDTSAKVGEQALRALQQTDLIVTGLGSLHTSVAPNMLVDGVLDVMEEKPVLWVANLMNAKYHTNGWSLLDHLEEFKRLCGGRQVVNRVLFNTAPLPPVALREQMEQGSEEVSVDVDELKDAGYDIVASDLAATHTRELDPNDDPTIKRATIMHDAGLLGKAVMREWYRNGFIRKTNTIIG